MPNLSISQVSDSVRPGRRIEGISAVLLPYRDDGQMDLDSFQTLLRRTADAGLTPAVNMDTGYANLLSDAEREQVLKLTQQTLGARRFVAGAFVEGKPGDPLPHYRAATDRILSHGGTPILFQCSAMKGMDDRALVRLYRDAAQGCGNVLAFELGDMFAPFGRIFDLSLFQALMEIEPIRGIKHSSLNRELEWRRLELRDRLRPDFKVYTGNDLAIDMVTYGSDYLLGLSAFHPEAFALRDRLWEAGDARFYGLNDLLQYLGFFAFRPPVPAYKHSASQFLKLRGVIPSDAPHPAAPRRPESDLPILRDVTERIDAMMAQIHSAPSSSAAEAS